MKSRPVTYVPDLLEQVREQMLYIAQDSIENALLWEDRVMAAINALADFHGHAIDEDASKKLGYPVHKLVFEGTYLIFYRIDENADEVRVVNFRHGARLPREGGG